MMSSFYCVLTFSIMKMANMSFSFQLTLPGAKTFQSDSDSVGLVLGALESIHASLAVMANSDMPKQLYKEEVIAS